MMVSNFADLDLRRLMVFTKHVRPPRCHSCMQHLMGLGGVSSASMHPFFLPFHPDTYLGKLQTLIYFWSVNNYTIKVQQSLLTASKLKKRTSKFRQKLLKIDPLIGCETSPYNQ